MEIIALTIYVLIWPVVVAATLFYIGRAFIAEWRQARREGRRLV